MIEKNKLTLKRVFNDFDKAKKGYLNFQEFKELSQKMLKEMSDDDVLVGFKMVDENNSNTINFKEMSLYYNKINNLTMSN